jgi:hypothetical protein
MKIVKKKSLHFLLLGGLISLNSLSAIASPDEEDDLSFDRVPSYISNEVWAREEELRVAELQIKDEELDRKIRETLEKALEDKKAAEEESRRLEREIEEDERKWLENAENEDK